MENSEHDDELVPKENYVTGVYIVIIGELALRMIFIPHQV